MFISACRKWNAPKDVLLLFVVHDQGDNPTDKGQIAYNADGFAIVGGGREGGLGLDFHKKFFLVRSGMNEKEGCESLIK